MTTADQGRYKTPGTVEMTESDRRRTGWAMALRGIVAVIFGLVAMRYPSAAAGAFVIIFAVFAFADAILEIVVASFLGRSGLRWGWYAVGALASLAAGIVAIAYPQITFFALVLLVGARAVVVGALEIGAAVSFRELDSRWLLGLVGAVSIVFGLLLFASPSRGGLALIWTIGIYAIILGVVLFALGIRLVGGRGHGIATRSHPAAA